MGKGLFLALSLIGMVVLLVGGCARQSTEPAEEPSEPAGQPIEPGAPTEEKGYWPTFNYKLVGYEKTTLEEASTIVGQTIPTPTYLPYGCTIQEVVIKDGAGSPRVEFVISDKEILWKEGEEFQCVMMMQIGWWGSGTLALKIVGHWLEIRGSSEGEGVIKEYDDFATLWWHWHPDPSEHGGFEIALSVSKDFPRDELIKVAESVHY